MCRQRHKSDVRVRETLFLSCPPPLLCPTSLLRENRLHPANKKGERRLAAPLPALCPADGDPTYCHLAFSACRPALFRSLHCVSIARNSASICRRSQSSSHTESS